METLHQKERGAINNSFVENRVSCLIFFFNLKPVFDKICLYQKGRKKVKDLLIFLA